MIIASSGLQHGKVQVPGQCLHTVQLAMLYTAAARQKTHFLTSSKLWQKEHKTPFQPTNVKLTSVNTRSCKDKTLDQSVMLFLTLNLLLPSLCTETWLCSQADGAELAELSPLGFLHKTICTGREKRVS